MFPRVVRASCLLAACAVCQLNSFSAEPQWVKARLGSFDAISDSGRRSAVEGLSQFEQFRFALGSVMGKPDLVFDPPLRILVFRNAQEMATQGFAGLRMGREQWMACATAEGQLPPALVGELTHRMLEDNFSSMAGPTETALETFFSTVQSSSVHVTWGAPPPAAERTRDWAMLHMMITQPDYSGRAHIYLHNLAAGMDTNGAVRSLGEDPAKFNAEVDRYFNTGVFSGAQAPSRALNTERDFRTTNLTADEGRLMRADLLTPASEAEYQALLKAGKHVTEDNEGLGILAMRAGDAVQAQKYMEEARRGGTKNSSALTSYSALVKDPESAMTILKEALTADPKYAPAHWALGERITDPRRRLAEWKQAVSLAPRRYDWWAQYAQLCLAQKQYAEAGRAWVDAAQAAPDAELRAQYLDLRGQIDQQRRDDEAAERRKEAAAAAADMDRLKSQARKELADLEARANANPLSKDDGVKTVDWDQIDKGAETMTGMLVRVECVGRQLRLDVKDDAGKTQRLLVPDPSLVEMTGADPTVACGSRKPRPVRISYKPGKDKNGVTGEATRIEFR